MKNASTIPKLELVKIGINITTNETMRMQAANTLDHVTNLKFLALYPIASIQAEFTTLMRVTEATKVNAP